jgi:hypothetical protein
MKMTVVLCLLAAVHPPWNPADALVIEIPEDFPSITEGLAVADSGDTVLVGAGTWYEHDILLPSGVQLISEEGSGVTIIDALGLGRVIEVEDEATNTTGIRGFTLTGGNSGAGGGICCLHGSPWIEGNLITGNTAVFGGGIALGEGNPPARIRGNEILQNFADVAGGAIYGQHSSAIVDANYFAGNECLRDGGCMYCEDAGMTIADNVIVLNGCVGHAGAGGGIFCAGAPPLIQGNIIARNWHGPDGVGGAIACYSDNSTITSNTISHNYGGAGGAVYVCTTWGIELDRNVISFQDGTAVRCYCGPVSFTCCNFHGNGANVDGCASPVGSDGNFSEDPLFCDPDNDDFRLDCMSPCVDSHGCGLIGALGVGCGASRVEPATWGGIKAMYR